jgi:hypothetical protein
MEKPLIELENNIFNTMVLIGMVGDLGKASGFSNAKIRSIKQEMRFRDCEGAFQVFERELGHRYNLQIKNRFTST